MWTLHRRAFLRLAAGASWATMSPGRANAAPTVLAGLNVKDYGAIGDGTTDDTPAIHAARDATGVGGRIVIPGGNYLVSGLTASIENQTWELSDDAVIHMMVGAGEILLITAAGVSVVGGVFEGANGTLHDGSQNGVKAFADGFTIRNATIQNSPFYGIAVFNSSQLTITGCTVNNSYAEAIWVRNSLAGPSNLYDISITDNLVNNSSGGQYASGIGVHGDGFDQRINRVSVRANTITLPYSQTSEITGCIGPLNCTDFVVSDNVCTGGNISISCSNALRGTISNNKVRGFSIIGVELPVDPRQGPGEVNHVAVIGNLVDPDGVSATAGIQTSAFGPSATGNISNLRIAENTIQNFANGCNLINFGSGSVCSWISINGNTLASAVPSGQFSAVTFNSNIMGLSMSDNIVDGSSTANSCGVLFFRSALGVSITANQFGNLSVAVNLGSYSGTDTLDYINITGNTLVNCEAKFKNSTANGAAVGTVIFTD